MYVRQVYYLGEEGLKTELELKGIETLGGIDDNGKHGLDLPQDLGEHCEADPPCCVKSINSL